MSRACKTGRLRKIGFEIPVSGSSFKSISIISSTDATLCTSNLKNTALGRQCTLQSRNVSNNTLHFPDSKEKSQTESRDSQEPASKDSSQPNSLTSSSISNESRPSAERTEPKEQPKEEPKAEEPTRSSEEKEVKPEAEVAESISQDAWLTRIKFYESYHTRYYSKS